MCNTSVLSGNPRKSAKNRTQRLRADESLYPLIYPGAVQSVVFQQRRAGARLSKFVLNPQSQHFDEAKFPQRLGNRAAQTADDGMFLHRDHPTRFRRAAGKQGTVQRLNRVDVIAIQVIVAK